MANVVDLASRKNKKRRSKRLEETRQVLRITLRFYKEIEPYFKYRLIYDMGKKLLPFRADLVRSIREIKNELKEY